MVTSNPDHSMRREGLRLAHSTQFTANCEESRMKEKPEFDDEVDDEAPTEITITPYDERHFIIYLRLLDADAQNIDWRQVARDILLREPSSETGRVKHCWASHLARARWMSEQGYRQLIR
jgi:hypothetical protein